MIQSSFQSVIGPTKKTFSIYAVNNVSTRHVTDLTETVCVMTNMVNSVIRIGETIWFLRLLGNSKENITAFFFSICVHSMWNVQTKDVPSYTIWVVVLSLSLLIHIVFIFVTFIS